MQITIPSDLSDTELVAAVGRIAARSREAGAQLVAHLAEMEARELHLRYGYRSLFVYCTDVLHLSEWEAYNRIEAARTARRFPVVLDRLAEGAVTLTAVRHLGPHLTSDNHAEVLASARGKTKVEVQEIVARLAPPSGCADFDSRSAEQIGFRGHAALVGAASVAGVGRSPAGSAAEPAQEAAPVSAGDAAGPAPPCPCRFP